MLARASIARSLPYKDAATAAVSVPAAAATATAAARPPASRRDGSDKKRNSRNEAAPRPRAMFYIDTHAGAGRYDLHGQWASTNQEFRDGIVRAWQHRHDIIKQSPSVDFYFRAIDAANDIKHLPPTERIAMTPNINAVTATLPNTNHTATAVPDFPYRWYPGSPWFVRWLQKQDQSRDGVADRSILHELHPNEFKQLRREFLTDSAVQVHSNDGLTTLISHLPPSTPHGFVLIDPSYEQRGDMGKVLATLREVAERWNQGTIAIWLPILRNQEWRAHEFMNNIGMTMKDAPILSATLSLDPLVDMRNDTRTRRQKLSDAVGDGKSGMSGSSMMIINPPRDLQPEMEIVMPWLQRTLAMDGYQRVKPFVVSREARFEAERVQYRRDLASQRLQQRQYRQQLLDEKHSKLDHYQRHRRSVPRGTGIGLLGRVGDTTHTKNTK